MKTIRLGIIGMGGRGRFFLRTYRNAEFPGFAVKAVCDLDPALLRKAENEFPDGFTCHTDMHEMLRTADIDGVIVATNDPHHVEPVIASLRAGKHVLAEKPLCQTIEDARRIAEEIRRAAGIFMMGFEAREITVFQQMKAFIDEGRIGEVKVAHALDNVGRCGCFFHVPNKQKSFYQSLLLQKGSHSLDLLNWFIGRPPVKVYGTGGQAVFGAQPEHPVPEGLRCSECDRGAECPFYIDRGSYRTEFGEAEHVTDECVWSAKVDLNDHSELCISYAGGAKATFQEIYFTPEYSREFWLVGSRGKMYGYYDNPGRFLIRITKLQPARRYAHQQGDLLRDVEEYWPVAKPGVHGGGDFALRAEFHRRIVENDRQADVIESAYYSTALAACGEESIETGQAVDIPPL